MQKNRMEQGFSEIYRDLAELIGVDKTLIIYENMKGQQITLPKRLYTTEYIKQELTKKYTGNNLKELAKEFNYTERYIRKLLNNVQKNPV